MATIQFKTAQNIQVEYALAGLWERVGAYTMDLISLYFVYFTFKLLLDYLIGSSFSNLICFTLIFTTLLIQEVVFNGRTLGKMLLGLKVIKTNGKEPRVFDYLVRWAFRSIEILFSLGLLAMAAVATSSFRQRLGDVVASTVVIKVPKSNKLALESFLRREEKEIVIRYPQAAKLSEQSALLLKNMVLRFEKYPNENNQKLRREVVQKLKSELEIHDQIKDENKFIRLIISDYILSTR